MIISVTFNPAVDKTAEVEALQVGELNRLKNVILDAGGKGINVSKTIQALGGSSLCTGFLAGSTGEYIQNSLHALSILCDFIWVDGMTRTNLKVLDKNRELTEINEPGPTISKQEVDKLMNKILSLTTPATIVVLSGNVPSGTSISIYKDLIVQIKKQGGRVILDADKDLLAQGLQAHPTIIKPNTYELTMYFKMPQDSSNESLIKAAKTLLNEDTKLIVISMGEKGSIFITEDAIYQADALAIEAHSSVGAGDAMVAAIAYAMQADYGIEKLMALAVASSAGAVMSKGTKPARKEQVEALMKQVKITRWE